MGKAILIIVAGISIIVTLLIINLNANANASLSTTIDFFETTQARLIANSGIEVYLEKLRRNKALTGNFLNNSLMNGKYDLYISGADTLSIRAISSYVNKVHTSLVIARRNPVVMPNVSAALQLSSSSLTLNLNGNVDIDGNDHNLNGTPGPAPAVPGVGVDTPTDSAFVVNEISKKISKTILGSGATPSVYTVPKDIDWKAVTENFIFSADTVLATGTYTNGSKFGTKDKPIITYASGSVDFTDATGYGIMVVNGDIKLSGNFSFYGIVIAYGQTTIRTNTIGNNGIYGGTIIVGDNIQVESQGNSSFYYSSEAIANSQLNLKSSRFEILSWWE